MMLWIFLFPPEIPNPFQNPPDFFVSVSSMYYWVLQVKHERSKQAVILARGCFLLMISGPSGFIWQITVSKARFTCSDVIPMPSNSLDHELNNVSWIELCPGLASSQNQIEKRERCSVQPVCRCSKKQPQECADRESSTEIPTNVNKMKHKCKLHRDIGALSSVQQGERSL